MQTNSDRDAQEQVNPGANTVRAKVNMPRRRHHLPHPPRGTLVPDSPCHAIIVFLLALLPSPCREDHLSRRK